MSEVMTKQEFLEIVNFEEMQYELRVKYALDYIKQQDVAAPIVNAMIKYMKDTKNFSQMHIQNIFLDKLRDILYGTAICPNGISFTRVANHIMINSMLIQHAFNLFKIGKTMVESKDITVEEAHKQEEKPEKRKKQKLTQEQMEEAKRIRLAKQAQIMREAKARKKLENNK